MANVGGHEQNVPGLGDFASSATTAAALCAASGMPPSGDRRWRPVIAPGDICQGGSGEHVAVLSNSLHLKMNTGWVVICPFIPGIPSDDASLRSLVNHAAISSGIVEIGQPEGVLVPELVRCVSTSTLGEPMGTVDAVALSEAVSIVGALIS